MNTSRLDHIVVTASTLDAGAEYIRGALGVAPQAGGEHPKMGTHNRLLRLGERCYLEVIAVNPEAPVPRRRRWFDLDRRAVDARPALAAWVARTADIRSCIEASSENVGSIWQMSRGSLDWDIAFPDDGRLVLGGAAPLLIQWASDLHPAASLHDAGLVLRRLEISHPQPGRILALLESIGFEGPVRVLPGVNGMRLRAEIETPDGRRVLDSGR